jgi:hypothetical protein
MIDSLAVLASIVGLVVAVWNLLKLEPRQKRMGRPGKRP